MTKSGGAARVINFRKPHFRAEDDEKDDDDDVSLFDATDRARASELAKRKRNGRERPCRNKARGWAAT